MGHRDKIQMQNIEQVLPEMAAALAKALEMPNYTLRDTATLSVALPDSPQAQLHPERYRDAMTQIFAEMAATAKEKGQPAVTPESIALLGDRGVGIQLSEKGAMSLSGQISALRYDVNELLRSLRKDKQALTV